MINICAIYMEVLKMNKMIMGSRVSRELNNINADIQRVSGELFNIANDDVSWWKANIKKLISQPLAQTKRYLSELNDHTLAQWDFGSAEYMDDINLEPIDSIVWLTSLCRIDTLLCSVLPNQFTEHMNLFWRIYACNWITE